MQYEFSFHYRVRANDFISDATYSVIINVVVTKIWELNSSNNN